MTTSSAFSLRISKKSIRVLCHGGLQELLGFLHFLSSLFSEKPIGLPLPGTFFVFASICFMLWEMFAYKFCSSNEELWKRWESHDRKMNDCFCRTSFWRTFGGEDLLTIVEGMHSKNSINNCWKETTFCMVISFIYF